MTVSGGPFVFIILSHMLTTPLPDLISFSLVLAVIFYCLSIKRQSILASDFLFS